MNRKHGFTLAEVLITLAIIGVVAAMTIPALLMSTGQQEFKTGLKKAISALNQAITMNYALESSTPGDMTTADELYAFFKNRMSIVRDCSVTNSGCDTFIGSGKNTFYTTDGMRYDFTTTVGAPAWDVATGEGDTPTITKSGAALAKCTATDPCAMLVDVNGDKKPNPADAGGAAITGIAGYKFPAATDTRIMDMFAIMITDSAAVPLGTIAQKTMFDSENRQNSGEEVDPG